MENKICPECEDEMQEITVPKEFPLFKIPFTTIELIFRYCIHDYYCNYCTYEKANEPYKEAYKQGMQDAYEQFNKEY